MRSFALFMTTRRPTTRSTDAPTHPMSPPFMHPERAAAGGDGGKGGITTGGAGGGDRVSGMCSSPKEITTRRGADGAATGHYRQTSFRRPTTAPTLHAKM